MPKARVLLVEDSRPQAEPVKEFLEREGYEIIWAVDGKSAIRVAKTEQIDVVLLDFVLPDINGNEICRWLKHDKETRGIPIIMLTVKNTTEDKVSSFEAGADDYLAKPFSEMELNARIYAALRTKALQDELRQKNRQLEEMLTKVEALAITDPLTGLYNRRRFEAVLENEFHRMMRYKLPLSCVMMDIDHFKSVNDTYGHKTGDSVLREIAEVLRRSIRAVDTPARWGGEEFIVLLPQTGKKDAMMVAQRLLQSVSQHPFTELPNKEVTVSIGLASAPDSSIDSIEKLIHASDEALYNAKRNGRNRIEVS